MKPLVLYFTANYPSMAILSEFIARLDSSVVKYVELGIPTDNPLYDGPTIKVTHGVSIGGFRDSDLKLYSDMLKERDIRTYLLVYYHELRKRGSDFLHYLRDIGISGLIIPDLFIDYFDSGAEVIKSFPEGLEFIPFFNPATPDGVIRSVAEMTRSWIYYGLQPSTGINVPFDLKEVSGRILEMVPGREVNFGFGIRTVEQVREILDLGSDGVAIGSMLIPMLKENRTDDFVRFQKEVGEMMKVVG